MPHIFLKYNSSIRIRWLVTCNVTLQQIQGALKHHWIEQVFSYQTLFFSYSHYVKLCTLNSDEQEAVTNVPKRVAPRWMPPVLFTHKSQQIQGTLSDRASFQLPNTIFSHIPIIGYVFLIGVYKTPICVLRGRNRQTSPTFSFSLKLHLCDIGLVSHRRVFTCGVSWR